MSRSALFLSYCRIVAGLNDSMRVRYGGVDATVTLDTGVYPVGYVSTLDATLFGTTTLFSHIVSKIGASLTVTFAVEYNGHITWDFPANGDGVYWGNAATTIDPLWFGVCPVNDVYPTKTVTTGGVGQDLSDVSSSLCMFVRTPNGGRTIHRETRIDRRVTRANRVDSGKTYRVSYGSEKGSRDFSLLLGGIERDRDNAYQTALRWRGEILDQGQSFLYVPDYNVIGKTWSPEESAENRRYGRQRMTFDADDRGDWEPGPEYGDLYSVWRQEFRAVPHVP